MSSECYPIAINEMQSNLMHIKSFRYNNECVCTYAFDVSFFFTKAWNKRRMDGLSERVCLQVGDIILLPVARYARYCVSKSLWITEVWIRSMYYICVWIRRAREGVWGGYTIYETIIMCQPHKKFRLIQIHESWAAHWKRLVACCLFKKHAIVK